MLTEVSLALALLTACSGVVAGVMGGMLGLGGGVFLVPVLVQALGVPMPQAVAVSLTTVVATSNAVSGSMAGRQYINLRLGFLLELLTAAGGLLGSLVAVSVAPRALMITFGVVMVLMSVLTFVRRAHRNNLPESADPGEWGGRFIDEVSGEAVVYRVTRMPLALATSFVAGILSTLLGLGGGVVKVPVLNAWCGVPMRVVSATSAFMIGVTATSGALVYFGRGLLLPVLAASAVLGVRVGSTVGLRLGRTLSPARLKTILAVVLLGVAALMVSRLP
ncbi:MAG: sulfite exporter TauE/SafE family protein [Acidobacteria bacterium]|nr:sulfite exporter TauE/SafE family protein [Acidobacteriota bacterium]